MRPAVPEEISNLWSNSTIEEQQLAIRDYLRQHGREDNDHWVSFLENRFEKKLCAKNFSEPEMLSERDILLYLNGIMDDQPIVEITVDGNIEPVPAYTLMNMACI
ncbi:MAG: hypothetical protein D6B25_08410 [Desulfobulbaceae bacterium]|nr:MAG: hypothetical protein D6B25_08410 [Desulfobulbaceae bacterium]